MKKLIIHKRIKIFFVIDEVANFAEPPGEKTLATSVANAKKQKNRLATSVANTKKQKNSLLQV
jgi:hypothetical protein